MAAKTRIVAILACSLLASAAGCALAPKKTVSRPPLTAEQAAWWEENRSRKRYIPGRGYYVEGTSGFFDESGHRITSEFVERGHDEPAKESLLDKMAPKKIYKQMKVAVGQGPNEQIARREMEEGDALFRQKQFKDAANRYRKAYKRWPDSPLEEEALYKAGESEFFADRYSKADDQYGMLVKKFPSTQYMSQLVIRRFAIARYWEEADAAKPHWALTPNMTDKTRPVFDTAGHAIRVYERIRLDDPTGPLADDSIMATATAYYSKGRWEDADYHYGLLRTEYPKSEHQYKAHLLGLRCKLLRYQGPGYDGTPLDQAEELATQLLTQFGPELGDKRESVAQVRASIRSERAQREWDVASYYDKHKHYGSSKIYYTKIIDDYPETQLAQQARTRIDEAQGLPEHPTPPFQWLVDLLPASKREGPILPKSVTAPQPVVASKPNTNATR